MIATIIDLPDMIEGILELGASTAHTNLDGDNVYSIALKQPEIQNFVDLVNQPKFDVQLLQQKNKNDESAIYYLVLRNNP